MRILLVNQQTSSGNDVFFDNLQEALNKHSSAICTKVSIGKGFFSGLRDLQDRNSTSSSLKADIAVANVEQIFPLKGLGIPIVGIAHHDPVGQEFIRYLNPIRKTYYKYILGRRFRKGLVVSDRIVSVSRYTANAIYPLVDEHSWGKLSTIPNGIDVDYFTPGESVSRKNGTRKLLFVGNPSVRKGFDLLPGIMKDLGPQYELVFTSGLRSGAKLASDALNMRSIGKLTQDELLAAYRECDVLLFPSRLEGFGYAAVEALSCGLPVVGVDCCTLPEILPPVLHDFQAKEHDPKQIAEKVRECANAKIQKEELHTWVRTRFSLVELAENYHKLFSELLDNGPDGGLRK